VFLGLQSLRHPFPVQDATDSSHPQNTKRGTHTGSYILEDSKDTRALSKSTFQNSKFFFAVDARCFAMMMTQEDDTLPTPDVAASDGDRTPNRNVTGMEEVNDEDDNDFVSLTDSPDVYGQIHPIETPAMVSRKLQQFRQALQSATTSRNVNDNGADEVTMEWRAAKIALEEYSNLWATDEFLILFLRCELFHIPLAVQRYCRYWNQRVKVFGNSSTNAATDDAAYQPMTLSRIISRDDRDKNAMYNESIQIVSIENNNKDDDSEQQQRSYVFLNPSKQDKTRYTRESMLRAFWYKIHAILQDDDLVQKRGLIIVAYPHHAKFSQFDRHLAKSVLKSVQGCLPVRLSAFHVCHPPSFFRIIYGFIQMFLSQRLKQRIHIHYHHHKQHSSSSSLANDGGSESSIVQVLSTRFDIPKPHLPTELGGDLVMDQTAWLENRLMQGK
jgi:hypothetical protein